MSINEEVSPAAFITDSDAVGYDLSHAVGEFLRARTEISFDGFYHMELMKGGRIRAERVLRPPGYIYCDTLAGIVPRQSAEFEATEALLDQAYHVALTKFPFVPKEQATEHKKNGQPYVRKTPLVNTDFVFPASFTIDSQRVNMNLSFPMDVSLDGNGTTGLNYFPRVAIASFWLLPPDLADSAINGGVFVIKEVGGSRYPVCGLLPRDKAHEYGLVGAEMPDGLYMVDGTDLWDISKARSDLQTEVAVIVDQPHRS